MRRTLFTAACAVVTMTTALVAPASALPNQASGQASEYVVLYKDGVSLTDARAAVEAAGGTIVRENTDVGVATVRSTDTGFAAQVRRQGALDGAAANRVIGRAPKTGKVAEQFAVEKEGRGQTTGTTTVKGGKKGEEPLADLQWDMKQIHATAKGSYRVEPGDRRVTVGVIDTGIDGSHPDIKPNFNRALSRNFTVDVPVDANGAEVDGPCAEEPDKSCNDPADVDENEHGTHVASTIASPRNGLGMAGVAPNVSLVNLRAGQDSGYFFLQPTVDALTYAGRHGIDVVNMSYYIDPWLFNCANNPADSPADQAEQQTIIKAANRALNFAHRHGVTLVAAAGNEAIDYTKTNTDATSPDFASEPGEQPYERTIPASCLSLPGEGDHVIPVSSTGISKRKAYYSSYGKNYITVAAPGGDKYDTADRKLDDKAGIWAAYPESIARARGELNADGTPNTPRVVRSCKGGVCGYYQSIQGTSMASPHAAGVAALIVSKYGKRDRADGGLTLASGAVRSILTRTASATACPPSGSYTYTRQVKQADGSFEEVVTTHACEGSKRNNGFYGKGIVDALNAVRR
ncbi:S8 family serine peptidase [Actinomadura algeriensis]|uniref:Subtilisin family serine protease n=1 Tax=Actinomadura algeriensis TaxID=1679523 RepID=A0ABR9JRM1_9ACTN|nr:S8 family serine peptidase [Actinomadura algeriensis]MBE1533177.1 subtilisin family serine protease [Actinomadura algeriensis]